MFAAAGSVKHPPVLVLNMDSVVYFEFVFHSIPHDTDIEITVDHLYCPISLKLYSTDSLPFHASAAVNRRSIENQLEFFSVSLAKSSPHNSRWSLHFFRLKFKINCNSYFAVAGFILEQPIGDTASPLKTQRFNTVVVM